MRRIRLGIMGFGLIGRQLYQIATEGKRFEVPVVSDIGAPDILHHLLTRDARDPACRLVGNHLDNDVFTTRMLRTDQPREVPWDAFGVDAVVAPGGARGRGDARSAKYSAIRRSTTGVVRHHRQSLLVGLRLRIHARRQRTLSEVLIVVRQRVGILASRVRLTGAVGAPGPSSQRARIIVNIRAKRMENNHGSRCPHRRHSLDGFRRRVGVRQDLAAAYRLVAHYGWE